ncbi:unnamed protein product [Periconia digitata]|uniref:Uncharacterized protein n=1 Tax=Periconia digitata TaxID=1303443 RepID=A0A9W4U8R9_9PLEO|nr:unnamed protein product [Periconia digitata]
MYFQLIIHKDQFSSPCKLLVHRPMILLLTLISLQNSVLSKSSTTKIPSTRGKIRAPIKGSLSIIFNIIFEGNSAAICAAAFAANGGLYATLLVGEIFHQSVVISTFTLGYTGLNVGFTDKFSASQTDFVSRPNPGELART